MNWAWVASLDHFWRSPSFPMWLTMAAAGFFGLIALIALLRAEKSVANVALTVITLLAIGVAVAATLRGFGPEGGGFAETQSARPTSAASPASPALSCIDDLAGETVLAACEKVLFGSAESAAAAVSYAASRINRLTASGDVAAANNAMTGDLQALRRSVERDRYGLMAYVLVARDRCTPSDCAIFQALTDRRQIVANMDEKIYDGLIARYASSWNMPPAPAATGPVAAFAPSMATGKPTTADFPSAASTPAVNIMTPEPGQAAAPPPPRPAAASLANAPLPSPRPAASTAATAPALASAKKPPAPKQPRSAGPVQLAPVAPAASTASAPDAND
jgi:hypothetical protein